MFSTQNNQQLIDNFKHTCCEPKMARPPFRLKGAAGHFPLQEVRNLWIFTSVVDSTHLRRHTKSSTLPVVFSAISTDYLSQLDKHLPDLSEKDHRGKY